MQRSRQQLRPAKQAQRDEAANPQSLADILRDEIISLRLAPGAALSRVELQDKFGVSSTPLRDAFMRLAEEGLVEVFPQYATKVTLIDIPRAEQAQFLRRALEQEVVRVLAEAPDRELVRDLKRHIARQRDAAEAKDYDAFQAADQEFHRTMFLAAGAPDLWWLMRRHAGHIDRIRRLGLPAVGKMAQILRDHGAVVKAVADGEPVAAQAAMRVHLSQSIAHWGAMRQQFPGFFREEALGAGPRPHPAPGKGA
jgi:GntR family transcriptional regulator, rspAB operon transcriptional repressor